MQTISNSVGEGGVNQRSDTALVQARLRLTQRPAAADPARKPYLATIDGDCGPRTQAALRLFQVDQVFVTPDGRSVPSLPGATAGQVRPGDVTWQRLVAATPSALADLRVLDGGATVYLAASAHDLGSALTAAGAVVFEARFATQVKSLIQRIHQACGVVIRVCPDGARRTFQKQYELLISGRKVTKAGPGESNHNFGQAVDLGFKGLRWLRKDGSVVENEDPWLHQLDPNQVVNAEARRFWALLRTHSPALGLHRGPESDLPHLQAWPDTGVDMASRLAALLSLGGRMRWTGRRQRYQCDLGYGGALVEVGSAAEVWSGQAPITAALLTQLRANMPASALVSVSTAAPAAKPAPVTAADVSAMKLALQAEFQAADAQWTRWTAQ